MGRLVSWKRIARYLERSERTVRRWAAEDGLPVHRISSRPNSSVYALSEEIDGWLATSTANSGPAAGNQRTILALLPFENLSADNLAELFVDGLTDETIAALGQVAALGVIARRSVDSFRGSKQSVAEIGAMLNAQYIIEGSLRSENNVARVTAQLIIVADQTQLWAQNYEYPMASPMAMQQHIARQIACDVGLQLTGAAPQLHVAAAAIDGPGSDEYFKGRYFLNKLNAQALRQSVKAFERAIALEPRFGPAYGGKAEALQLLTNIDHVKPDDVMPAAVAAINRAVALSPNSAEVFASLGFIHSSYTRDWAAGEEAFEQSLRLNPNLAVAHQWYAEMLAILGRFEKALTHINEARRLDPLSLAMDASKGHVLWLARRYDELIPAMQSLLSQERNYPLAYILLFSGYYEQGDYDEAVRVCQTAAQHIDDPGPITILEQLALGANGDPERIRACIGMLGQQADDVFISRFFFAMLYNALGDVEHTLACLEAADREGVWHVGMTGQCAMFDTLRQEPRFDQLLRHIGLYESRFRQQTTCVIDSHPRDESGR